ncbi:MAG: hypothetical protein ACPG8W_11200 [Candidatus Promineifilaceae bacterium]
MKKMPFFIHHSNFFIFHPLLMTLFVGFLLACYFGGFVLRDQHVLIRAALVLCIIIFLIYAYIYGNALF